ncbi:MAG TPA: AAA family ATPase [Gemmatimonadaceae bacterium]
MRGHARQHSQTQEHRRARLDPNQRSPLAARFEEELLARVVGQPEAVRALSSLYEIALAGMAPPNRPIGTLLFLGPTGAGKTRVAEAAAEVLFGDPNALIKVDCAEYQHGHEISKLIGSPPGYVGYADASPLLTQENLDRFQSVGRKLAILLIDEIEKASPVLWQMLLGVLDRATLTLGDNRRVDFSRTIVVMTSNLGAQEIAEMISGGIGFASATVRSPNEEAGWNERLRHTAIEAARRTFSPEFMNRIDKTVVFQPLGEPDMRRILDVELRAVQDRILCSGDTRFRFLCSDAAKELLLSEGTDRRYGARHLKRSVERLLVSPLARLVATGQVQSGDLVEVERGSADDELVFRKRPTAIPADVAPRSHTDDARRTAATVVVATTVAVTAAVSVTTGLAFRSH